MRALTEDQEKSLRYRLGLLCMATLGKRDRDMALCTEMVLDYVSELIKPGSTIADSTPEKQT